MARPRTGSNLSVAQLETLLEERRSELSKLTKEQSGLLAQLGEVEKRIAELGGKTRGRGRPAKSAGLTAGGRTRNEKSLVETLEQVLSSAGSAMKVGDIVDAVLKTGYHSGSDNFRGIVNQTLIKERRKFGNEGRGLYAIKGKRSAS